MPVHPDKKMTVSGITPSGEPFSETREGSSVQLGPRVVRALRVFGPGGFGFSVSSFWKGRPVVIKKASFSSTGHEEASRHESLGFRFPPQSARPWLRVQVKFGQSQSTRRSGQISVESFGETNAQLSLPGAGIRTAGPVLPPGTGIFTSKKEE
jgi:hypothetical protein